MGCQVHAIEKAIRPLFADRVIYVSSLGLEGCQTWPAKGRIVVFLANHASIKDIDAAL